MGTELGDFLREVSVMMKLEHPHVLRLHGLVLGQPLQMVSKHRQCRAFLIALGLAATRKTSGAWLTWCSVPAGDGAGATGLPACAPDCPTANTPTACGPTVPLPASVGRSHGVLGVPWVSAPGSRYPQPAPGLTAHHQGGRFWTCEAAGRRPGSLRDGRAPAHPLCLVRAVLGWSGLRQDWELENSLLGARAAGVCVAGRGWLLVS